MSEWRTTNQVAADEALQRAIEVVLEAYARAEEVPSPLEGRAIGEFIVIAALPGITEELSQTTAYEYILANGSIPWHNMAGLMRWAQMKMDQVMQGSDLDDE